MFTPAVDQRHGRIGIRHTLADGFHINVYSLAAARAGNFANPVASFKQPPMTADIDFQGWALYGSYVYLWEGEAYAGGPDPENATSKLWCYDINSGEVVDHLGAPRLCFGFASGVTGDRRANLFYRTKLV
ncbi:hypothetical protein [Kribbella sp. NBC_00359]|uniref:hypothetical protein n=1 Tax=Kribbella sp. NBC_00359 TaxID=2975966 RepID=UPI002E1D5ADD